MLNVAKYKIESRGFVNIEQKAAIALKLLTVQLEDLESINKNETGNFQEAFEKVLRWHNRTCLIIKRHVNTKEGIFFKPYQNYQVLIRPITEQERFKNTIEYYRSKLTVLIDTLSLHPASIFGSEYNQIENNEENSLQYFESIHPKIKEVSYKKFADQHYADSAESALKEVNHRIKIYMKSKHSIEDDGVSLMRRSFGGENPKIDITGNEQIELTRQNLQEGYGHLFAGAIQAIRNPKTHANIKIDSKKAIHFLFIASLLMYKLDEAGVD